MCSVVIVVKEVICVRNKVPTIEVINIAIAIIVDTITTVSDLSLIHPQRSRSATSIRAENTVAFIKTTIDNCNKNFAYCRGRIICDIPSRINTCVGVGLSVTQSGILTSC
ncbi:hypothetical protein D3C72_1802140 [compost metagenome]